MALAKDGILWMSFCLMLIHPISLFIWLPMWLPFSVDWTHMHAHTQMTFPPSRPAFSSLHFLFIHTYIFFSPSHRHISSWSGFPSSVSPSVSLDITLLPVRLSFALKQTTVQNGCPLHLRRHNVLMKNEVIPPDRLVISEGTSAGEVCGHVRVCERHKLLSRSPSVWLCNISAYIIGELRSVFVLRSLNRCSVLNN